MHWIRVLRADVNKVPVIEDVEEYARRWWEWWGNLQPDWRQRDTAGRPLARGKGDWTALRKPGRNGIRIVLLSLAWWGLIVADTRRDSYSAVAHEDWSTASKDVAWVVSKLATWAGKR